METRGPSALPADGAGSVVTSFVVLEVAVVGALVGADVVPEAVVTSARSSSITCQPNELLATAPEAAGSLLLVVALVVLPAAGAEVGVGAGAEVGADVGVARAQATRAAIMSTRMLRAILSSSCTKSQHEQTV